MPRTTISHLPQFASLESLDNGKPFSDAHNIDLPLAIKCFRYYAGWSDKICGSTVPIDGNHIAITRKEPIGVVAQIIPCVGGWPARARTFPVLAPHAPRSARPDVYLPPTVAGGTSRS